MNPSDPMSTPAPDFPFLKTPVQAALDDAEVLADYVASEAIADAEQHVSTIARVRESLSKNGRLMGEEQRDFYIAYAALAEAVRPVTVGSLRDSLDKYAPRRHDWRGRDLPIISCARRAALHLRLWAIVALLLLLTVQSYMLIGQNLLSAAPKYPADYAETIALNNLHILQLPEMPPEIPGGTNGADADGLYEPQTPVPEQLSELDKKMAGIEDLEVRRMRIGGMLKVWSEPARILARLITLHKPFSSRLEPEWRGKSDCEKTIVVSERIIDVLQQIFLPIVYGWLGAMAYVLRRIARESAERTYREDNRIGYSLRIWLGVVAGLAIGWFLRPEKVEIGGAASISPFALAFVAGYSVELLFAAMDRLVMAFSGTPAGSASASMAQPGMSGTNK